MNKIFSLLFVMFSAAAFSSIAAQEPPGNTGDVDLRDNDIRMRSMDMERAKRDANKSAVAGVAVTAEMKTDIEKKFPQIKEDFEGIQSNQSLIIKAYTTGEKIDHKQIGLSAEEITKHAERLDENLFAPETEQEKAVSKEKEEKAKPLKELIVDLDNAIGDFVSSPMFQNLRVVDPAVAGKARFDLARIMRLSELLVKEAEKTK